MFDVFISAKSEDYEHARRVYSFLIQRGVRAFFSLESLPKLGVADFRKQIDDALDRATHMIVVASAAEYAVSSWVEAEWGFFVNEKRSGRKSGNLITVTFGSLQPEDLPPSLRYYEVIPWKPQCQEAILGYVTLGAEPAEQQRSSLQSGKEERQGRPTSTTRRFKNSLDNVLVCIPPQYLPTDHPPDRTVYVAAACVSNGDYWAFVRDGGPPPSTHVSDASQGTWESTFCSSKEKESQPVVFVPHESARRFCDWLTRAERSAGSIRADEKYFLPSFQQWRHLARGNRLPDDAILGRTQSGRDVPPVAPVCSGQASPLGLFHLFGNVFEWCRDVVTRDIQRSDGRVFPKTPCYLTVGGGWASDRSWLEEKIRKGDHGRVFCPGGWAMKDGGFRLWLSVHSRSE